MEKKTIAGETSLRDANISLFRCLRLPRCYCHAFAIMSIYARFDSAMPMPLFLYAMMLIRLFLICCRHYAYLRYASSISSRRRLLRRAGVSSRFSISFRSPDYAAITLLRYALSLSSYAFFDAYCRSLFTMLFRHADYAITLRFD